MNPRIDTWWLKRYFKEHDNSPNKEAAALLADALAAYSKQYPPVSPYVLVKTVGWRDDPDKVLIHVIDTDTPGGQLVTEDHDKGYVDYLDWRIDDPETQKADYDGGILLTTVPVLQMFETDEEVATYYIVREYENSFRSYKLITPEEYEAIMGFALDDAVEHM